jgi:hypothetical protein
MALENMIDLRQHIKTPRQAGLRLMWFRDVWAIGIVCFVLFLFRLIFASESKLRDAVIIVLTSAAIASLEFFVFNWAPSNWIGVFSFVTIARVTHADELFEKVVKRLRLFLEKLKLFLEKKVNELKFPGQLKFSQLKLKVKSTLRSNWSARSKGAGP